MPVLMNQSSLHVALHPWSPMRFPCYRRNIHKSWCTTDHRPCCWRWPQVQLFQIAWKKIRDWRTRKAYSLFEIMPAVRVDPLLPPHPTSITLQTQTASSNLYTHSRDNPDKKTHPKQPQTSFWSQRRLFTKLSNCRENNHNTASKVNS
jgi:hypothetical protein